MVDPRWYGGNVTSTILKPEQKQALNEAMAEEQKVYERGGAVMYHSTKPNFTPNHIYAANYKRPFLIY